MIKSILPFLFISILGMMTASAQEHKIIRIAKLQIDPTQLENYKAALKVEMETSVQAEPGVLPLNAVADKEDSTRFTIFEIYADENAYISHLQSPHFKRYKNAVKNMVKSLELPETVPIVLESKIK